MLRALILFGFLLGIALCLSPVCAAPDDNTVRPLGIGLEGIAYPYPVQFLDLVIEGQALRMAYMDVAPTDASNGKTAVLLHGKSFSGNYWEDTIRQLAADGYRVVIPDQIGFGKSSKPNIRYSLDVLAANTKKLLDTLGVHRAAIVGHSFGGMLAIYFARTYPDITAALALENPIGLERLPQRDPAAVPRGTFCNRDGANSRQLSNLHEGVFRNVDAGARGADRSFRRHPEKRRVPALCPRFRPYLRDDLPAADPP
jgi:pimeloyl-ACP methyl ester carboxylesterase